MINIRRRSSALVLTVAIVLGVAACSGGGGGEQQPKAQPALQIFASDTPTYQANFNPFSPNALPGTRGMIYAPLMTYVGFKPGEGIPFLADKMTFNDDGAELTVSLRNALTWADGQALTSADVVYTFDLLPVG